jgi:hypothetical protein
MIHSPFIDGKSVDKLALLNFVSSLSSTHDLFKSPCIPLEKRGRRGRINELSPLVKGSRRGF